ncbi:MAG: substrate-binding domain-containing protein [Hamadaea sp.]|nr:substrate-binding domain-containing protein [Hamadaea sp.]
MTRTRRGVIALAALTLAVGATACESGKEPSAPSGPKDGPIKIFYLQKQATQDYFVGEAAGARKKAQELGVELILVDLGNDTSKTLDAVSTAVAQRASGIIIVVPDPSVGPAVAGAAKAANIPLLTSDDQLCVSKPSPADCAKADVVPRIGFSGTQMGEEVGKKAAELYAASGWKPEDTRIIAAWKQDVTVCGDRVKAALPAFKAAGGPDLTVIEVGTDNTPPDAQNKVAATVTANKAVKHWIVWGCNDENVTGGVAALENAGYKPADLIGVGINGDLACKAWSAGKATGTKATLWLNGGEVGALAVQSMYDKIKNGKEFAAEAFAKTTMVTPETYKSAGLACG